MLSISSILTLLLLLPILTSFLMFTSSNVSGMRTSVLFSSSLQFVLASFLVILNYNMIPVMPVSISLFSWINVFNFTLILTLDIYNLWFIFLTFLIQSLCIFYLWYSDYKYNKDTILFSICLFFTTFCLYCFFLSTDLITMYIFFEAVLIPFFIIIGFFGNPGRRVRAAYYFFFYTLVGSLGMLGSIVYIFVTYKAISFEAISSLNLTPYENNILFFLFFLAIAVKVPLFPIHLWLPEAHVEAPTVGSVILAALLLKMGGFAIIRILIPLFGDALELYQPFIFSICTISMIYAGLQAIRQTDIKKIIALSSIVHMSFTCMGLIIPSSNSIEAGILLMIGHGIVAAGLFYCVGFIYNRYGTRDLNSIGSLWYYTPNLALYFFLFILGNLSFPGTINFVPELGIFWSTFAHNHIITCFLFLGYIFNSVYNIWLLTRCLYGNFSNVSLIREPEDLSFVETTILFNLSLYMVIFGLFPQVILVLFK
jgi:proton-translocating NADH-quinone oxidoreductase chain M